MGFKVGFWLVGYDGSASEGLGYGSFSIGYRSW